MPIPERQSATQKILVFFTLIVFISSVMSPLAAFATDPDPSPSQEASPSESAAPSADAPESPAADPSEPASPDPSTAPSSEPTAPAPSDTPAPSDEPNPAPSEPAAPGDVVSFIVTFVAGTDASAQASLLASVGAVEQASVPAMRMRVVDLPANDFQPALDALLASPLVRRVDSDRTRAVEAAPNDTDYPDQWALPKIGWDQLYGTVGIAGSSTVAVLDTGVDATHPDLDGVVLPGTSVLDGSNGLSDPNGHGTWMAGIVAAETDNGTGIAGTGYAGVSVLPVTVLGADGTGQDSDIIAGVVYAADHGADVILMSFSNPGYSPSLQAAIDYAWASGAVLVAATGNDGSDAATFPAGDRGVIGVASTDQTDTLASSSNYGAAAFMAAPGVDIATTSSGGSVATISGTSAAAAEVAGAAALLKANESFLSNGVIVSRLARNADPAGDPAQTGNGRLNLLRAMADASTDSIQPAGAAPLGDGGPLVGPYALAANNSALEGWQWKGANPGWGGTMNGSNGPYAEGEVMPIRFTYKSAAIGTYTVDISYDYSRLSGSTTQYFIDNLATYNATQAGVLPCDGVASCTGTGTTNGLFRIYNGTITTVGPESTVPGGSGWTDHKLTLTFTVSAADINKTVVIVYGAHMARESDHGGAGTGAAAANGASANASALLTSGPGASGENLRQVNVNSGTVSPNNAPAAIAQAVNVVRSPSTAKIITLQGTDPDGNSLTFSIVSAPTKGTLGAITSGSCTLDGNGVSTCSATVTYTPTSATGPDSFTFRVNDGTVNSVTAATVSINTIPVASGQLVSTPMSTFKDILLSGSDADASSLTFSTVTGPSHGTLGTIGAVSCTTTSGVATCTATVRYTPTAGYTGADSFTFKVNDGTVDSTAATVSITVTSVNSAPAGTDKTITINEDASHTFAAADFGFSDSDGNAFASVLITSISGGGSLTLSGNPVTAGNEISVANIPNLVFTPTANANGSNYASFGFKVRDNGGTANGGVDLDPTANTISITVTAVNDAPVGVADSATTNEDTAATIDVIGNDTDVDGDTLSVKVGSITSPAHGTASLITSGGDAGKILYTPNANYNGPDSFSYRATDGSADSALTLVSITVTAVNDAPVNTVPGAQTTAEDTTKIFSTGNGNALSVADVDVAETGGTGDLGVSLSVVQGTLSLNSSTGLTFSLGNGSNDAMMSFTGTPAAINIALNGLSYTPDTNYSGPDSLVLTTNDLGNTGSGGAKSDTDTVAITVTPVNDAPVVAAIADQNVDEMTALTFSASATDVDGDTLTFSLVGAPAGATINASTGAFSWTPDEDQGPGSYTFNVRATDNGTPALYDDEELTVTVNEVNRAPTVAAIADKNVNEMTALTFTATATDPDLPANTLTFSLVGAPAGATINASTGAFSWTPDEDQGPGSYTFNVRATDNGTPALYDDEELTVTVNEVNRAPTVAAIADRSLMWGNELTFTATATDPDLPANTLTFSLVGAPAGATINASTGAFSWTPTSAQIGAHTFNVRATDNGTPALYDDEELTVTVGKRATTVVYSGDSGKQYSDVAAVSGTLTDNGSGTLQGALLASKSVKFTIGSQETSVSTSAIGVASGTITLNQPAASTTVATAFAGDSFYLASNDSDSFAISREETAIEYTGDTLKSTNSTVANSTTTLDLSAVVREQADGNLGNKLGEQRLTFTVYAFNDVTLSNPKFTCTVTIVPSATQGTGTAGCTTTQLGADNYIVKIVMTDRVSGVGYYSGNVDTGVVTITLGGTGFTTGGGWIMEPNLLSKSNFGFTVKYLKNGNVQGNSLYIYRKTVLANTVVNPAGGYLPAGEYNWIIKSNAMTGLTQTCSGTPKICIATFTGKSNITAVNRTTGVAYSLGGNYQFQVDVTDNGEPGSSPAPAPDRYAIRVWDTATGTYYQLGTPAGQIAINGGNIQVRP